MALALSAVAFIVWPERLNIFADLGHLWHKVGWPIVRGLFFMGLGLFVAMFIESLGWTLAIGRLASPLTNWARLPQEAAASFSLALVSGVSANAMLSEALEKGKLSPRALMVANLLNGSWPTFIVHLPSSLVVAFSFAGRAGLGYVSLMFAAATLRLFGAAFLGRLILPYTPTVKTEKQKVGRKKLKEIWPGLKFRFRRRIVTLFFLAAPIFYLITLIADLGFFTWLQEYTKDHVSEFFLPVEAAALIVFSITAEFSAGFVAAAALMQNATLTVTQAVAALILGNIISTPIRVLRWQLPYFLGFFKLRLGLYLIFANQTFRVLSLIFSLWLFWQIFN